MLQRIAVFLVVLVSGANVGIAQSFPDHPIKIVVGFAPGGNVDVIARLLAQEMSKGLGQTIIVENKPGQAGAIAAEAVARAAPDGYTLLLANGAHPVTAALYKGIRFKPVDDFAWISAAIFYPFVICVRKDSKFDDLMSLVKAGQTGSGAITYGSAGVGSIHHVTVESLALATKAKFQHVPYRGEAPAVNGLLGGDVEFMPLTSTLAVQHTQGGALRALAVTGRTRAKDLPEVPTVEEAGVPDYEVVSWSGLTTTAGTPASIVKLLRAEMVHAVNVPEIRSRFESFGLKSARPAKLRCGIS